jgi:hypothetical protein
LLYLVHVEEDKPGRLPPTHPLPVHQHPLRQGHTQEGIHRRGSFSSLPGIRQREVSQASPKFANEVGYRKESNLRKEQTVLEMAQEVLARQTKTLVAQTGQPFESALEAVANTDAGRQLR